MSSALFAGKPEETPFERAVIYAKGHHEFQNLYYKEHEKEFARLAQEGQAPRTLYIGCSDSRVVPELISSARPGEFFVIRTAGNFVPLYSDTASDGVSATIEYAVNVLGVKDIIVCGHSHCGAIRGLFTRKELQQKKLHILDRWLSLGDKAKELATTSCPQLSQESCYTLTEKLSVVLQINHLLSYPFIKEKAERQELYLHGWHFAIETGNLEYFDPASNQFVQLLNQ